MSIEDFLVRQLGLAKDLVENRISTIFLNGCCVDHIETAVIEDGSVLALSAALPGLAGASLRRGGYYACLRESITRSEEIFNGRMHEGVIAVKLFNLLIGELGPVFLKKGIIMFRPDIAAFFRGCKQDFWNQVESAHLEDRSVVSSILAGEDIYRGAESILISVCEPGDRE